MPEEGPRRPGRRREVCRLYVMSRVSGSSLAQRQSHPAARAHSHTGADAPPTLTVTHAHTRQSVLSGAYDHAYDTIRYRCKICSALGQTEGSSTRLTLAAQSTILARLSLGASVHSQRLGCLGCWAVCRKGRAVHDLRLTISHEEMPSLGRGDAISRTRRCHLSDEEMPSLKQHEEMPSLGRGDAISHEEMPSLGRGDAISQAARGVRCMT